MATGGSGRSESGGGAGQWRKGRVDKRRIDVEEGYKMGSKRRENIECRDLPEFRKTKQKVIPRPMIKNPTD